MAEEFGPFELERLLGRGGMAEVYLAHRTNEPARSLVLKRIRPDHHENDEYLRRFVLEAQVLSRLSHPNLVRFHEFGKVGDCHYIAMEHIKGYTLGRLIDRVIDENEPPPLEAGLFVAQGVLGGLAAMHSVKDEHGRKRPMLHRDITPNNVIVTAEGQPVLIDLGIAKDMLGPALTLPGKVIGVARYMSPEHRKAEFLDARADVFSASVIVFELLVGRSPWKPLESMKELLRVTFDPPEIPPDARARIPEDVLAVIVKGLACDAKDRFDSAEEMGRALAHCESSHIQEGARFVREWVASLGMAPDEELENPVLDHGPAEGSQDLVWSATGSISPSGKIMPPPPGNLTHDARILSIPPLPPPREAVLVTNDLKLDVHTAGRPVWVTALLITALVLGVLCGVILLRGHL